MPEPQSPGEEQFAAYLTRRQLAWEYEPEIGGRHPDFLVHSPAGDVACDVFEPEIRLPNQPGLISMDSRPALQGGYEARKRRQIHAVQQAGLPFVLVYAGTRSDIGIPEPVLLSAMFGQIQIVFPLDRGTGIADDAQAQATFGPGAAIQPERKRGLSAAAIITSFNPTKLVFERAMESNAFIGELLEIGDLAGYIDELSNLARNLIAQGSYDPGLTIERLTVMHNPYAEHPLDLTVFGGPHDLQRGLFEADYTDLAVGTQYHKVT